MSRHAQGAVDAWFASAGDEWASTSHAAGGDCQRVKNSKLKCFDLPNFSPENVLFAAVCTSHAAGRHLRYCGVSPPSPSRFRPRPLSPPKAHRAIFATTDPAALNLLEHRGVFQQILCKALPRPNCSSWHCTGPCPWKAEPFGLAQPCPARLCRRASPGSQRFRVPRSVPSSLRPLIPTSHPPTRQPVSLTLPPSLRASLRPSLPDCRSFSPSLRLSPSLALFAPHSTSSTPTP